MFATNCAEPIENVIKIAGARDVFLKALGDISPGAVNQVVHSS